MDNATIATLEAIQQDYGVDTVKLRIEGGGAMLDGLDGVEQVTDHGRYQQVRVNGDAQQLLRALAAKTTVHHFEAARPSLHEIFIRIAGRQAAEEVVDA